MIRPIMYLYEWYVVRKYDMIPPSYLKNTNARQNDDEYKRVFNVITINGDW